MPDLTVASQATRDWQRRLHVQADSAKAVIAAFYGTGPPPDKLPAIQAAALALWPAWITGSRKLDFDSDVSFADDTIASSIHWFESVVAGRSADRPRLDFWPGWLKSWLAPQFLV